MKSPFKRAIVYDLETGGLSYKYNGITEIAMVAIDLESLEIIDKMSVLLKPRLDLSNRLCSTGKSEDGSIEVIGSKDEAKMLFKLLAQKDRETNIKSLEYGEHTITLKNLEPLINGIEEFEKELLSKRGDVIDLKIYDILSRSKFKDIVEVYFNMCYNPIALDITKISKELIISEGVEYEEAFKKSEEFIKKHTLGNSKPILSGHNIKRFDNLYFDKFFTNNKADLYSIINSVQMIDTLEWSRLAFFELSGFSLGVVANELGLTLKSAHRALPDTIANAELLIKLLENLRGEGNSESTYEREKFKMNY